MPVSSEHLPWGPTRAISSETFRTVQMRTIFEHHKYDPQVGDTPLLTEYPILLKRSAWEHIAALAERLTEELLAAERALSQRPDLHKTLGIPSSIARLWSRGLDRQQPDVRVMRFDFHMTTEGWRISECNCDTPGGYNEAVGFTQLMLEHFPEARMAGNPASVLAQEIAQVASAGAHVAMIYPTAFAEDQQILRFLQSYLEACGLITHLASPTHLQWERDGVWLHTQRTRQKIAYLFRYFPAEWLPNIGWTARWKEFFSQTTLPTTNPTTALLPQSKRFPLVWDALKIDMAIWKDLLPRTRDLRQIPRERWQEWVLKPMYGRFGNDIAIPGVADTKLWTGVLKSARRYPQEWVAQQPFTPLPMQTPYGTSVYPCIGVYTVNGRACGLYGRINSTPIVDSKSRDSAILLIEDHS